MHIIKSNYFWDIDIPGFRFITIFAACILKNNKKKKNDSKKYTRVKCIRLLQHSSILHLSPLSSCGMHLHHSRGVWSCALHTDTMHIIAFLLLGTGIIYVCTFTVYRQLPPLNSARKICISARPLLLNRYIFFMFYILNYYIIYIGILYPLYSSIYIHIYIILW